MKWKPKGECSLGNKDLWRSNHLQYLFIYMHCMGGALGLDYIGLDFSIGIEKGWDLVIWIYPLSMFSGQRRRWIELAYDEWNHDQQFEDMGSSQVHARDIVIHTLRTLRIAFIPYSFLATGARIE